MNGLAPGTSGTDWPIQVEAGHSSSLGHKIHEAGELMKYQDSMSYDEGDISQKTKLFVDSNDGVDGDDDDVNFLFSFSSSSSVASATACYFPKGMDSLSQLKPSLPVFYFPLQLPACLPHIHYLSLILFSICFWASTSFTFL